MSVTYGNWKKGYKCIECKHELTIKEVYYSNGTCPYCGHSNKSTLVDYIAVIYRPKFKRVYFLKYLFYTTQIGIEIKEST